MNGDGLQSPTTATTLRLRNNKRSAQDGSFADTKEQLGYFVIEGKDLDVALDSAAKAPCAVDGSVEFRLVVPMPPRA